MCGWRERWRGRLHCQIWSRNSLGKRGNDFRVVVVIAGLSRECWTVVKIHVVGDTAWQQGWGTSGTHSHLQVRPVITGYFVLIYFCV